VERLTAQDLMSIWPEARGWSNDIGALVLLDGAGLVGADGRLPINALRDHIGRRLHLVPRFRQLLYRPPFGLGWPLWVDAPAMDLTEHIDVMALQGSADEPDLLLASEDLRRRRLSFSRPLWKMTFLTGLPHRRVGLFIKVHHAIADGMSGIATLGAFLDPVVEPQTPDPPPWTPARSPNARELFEDNLRRGLATLDRTLCRLAHPRAAVAAIRHGLPAVREAFTEGRAPRTSINAHPIGWNRRFSFVRSDLGVIRRVAQAHQAKVNDVLMTALAAGLRALLASRGECVDGLVLRAAVPVSLHAQRPGRPQGNLDGMMAMPLPVGEGDDIRRLRLIAADTRDRRKKARPQGGVLFRNPTIQKAFLGLMGRQHFMNTYAANVPGRASPLYLAGARVLELFPIVPITGNISIGVGALSYAGQFNITAVADRDLVPDIETFTEGMRRSLHVLEGAPLVATA
jgi:WS/DGAT/MGAT family acyltransferase